MILQWSWTDISSPGFPLQLRAAAQLRKLLGADELLWSQTGGNVAQPVPGLLQLSVLGKG